MILDDPNVDMDKDERKRMRCTIERGHREMQDVRARTREMNRLLAEHGISDRIKEPNSIDPAAIERANDQMAEVQATLQARLVEAERESESQLVPVAAVATVKLADEGLVDALRAVSKNIVHLSREEVDQRLEELRSEEKSWWRRSKLRKLRARFRTHTSGSTLGAYETRCDRPTVSLRNSACTDSRR
jgi:hypothetical protein